MTSINTYSMDFENYPISELDSIAELYDDNLLRLFVDNIKSKYNFSETEVEIRSFQNIK